MGDNDRDWTKCQKGGWECAAACCPVLRLSRCAGLHASRGHWDALTCILQHAVRHSFTWLRGASAKGLPRAAAAATGGPSCRQVTAGCACCNPGSQRQAEQLRSTTRHSLEQLLLLSVGQQRWQQQLRPQCLVDSSIPRWQQQYERRRQPRPGAAALSPHPEGGAALPIHQAGCNHRGHQSAVPRAQGGEGGI